MISIEEVDRTILELENKDTSFAVCEKLAWLYIVKDHIQGVSLRNVTPLEISGDSEFLNAVQNKESDRIWSILDALMSTIKQLRPRVYDAVMAQIANAPQAGM